MATIEMTGRKYTSFDEIKDEEYAYWQSIPAGERIAAGHQMSVEGYRAHGYPTDGSELKRVAVRFQADWLGQR